MTPQQIARKGGYELSVDWIELDNPIEDIQNALERVSEVEK